MDEQVNTQMTEKVEQSAARLLKDPHVQECLEGIKARHEATVETQIAITEIPAPPFQETERAEDFKRRLEDLGLEGVTMDAEGNVFGLYPGTGVRDEKKTLLVTAHLDTVFPEGTDTTVHKQDGILYAPGISDDTRGLAEVLAIVEAMKQAEIQPAADVIFGGTVGEEGTGDLRGVKAIFDNRDDIDAFISIDGSPFNQIIYQGTGSLRYQITFRGPGGHSFGDFGNPSAIHAMGRAINRLADLETSKDPKTTYTVGMVEGGSSINAISETATMYVDLRSNDKHKLQQLQEQFLSIVYLAVADENDRWGSDQLDVELELIGNRPAAAQAESTPIVQASRVVLEQMGETAQLGGPMSTDANYPMSLGIPSVALGIGGNAGGAHTLGEWFDPRNAWLAVQKNLLTILLLAGWKEGEELII